MIRREGLSKLRKCIFTDNEETLFFCVEPPDKPPIMAPTPPDKAPPTKAPPIVLEVDFFDTVLPSSINSTPIIFANSMIILSCSVTNAIF